jgi:hypothetical protein
MEPGIFYTIYKITNLINKKYYIGKHITKNLNDAYMGSGKLITKAIKKYGIESFKKEILFVFDNEIDMNKKESELVQISENTYNLCPGGHGGFGYVNNNRLNVYGQNGKRGYGGENLYTKEYSCKQSMIDKGRYELWVQKISKSMKKKFAAGEIINGFFGKKHTKKTKNKMKEIHKKNKHQAGEKNSQYGTCWIKKDQLSKKINKNDLEFYLSNGWLKGRLIKK